MRFGQQLGNCDERQGANMKGGLDHLGNHWRLKVFVGRQRGKVHHVSRNFTGTKRQAQSALAELVTEIASGRVATGHAITVADLIDRWLDAIEPDRSISTMHGYRRITNVNIKPFTGAVRLDRLTGQHQDRLYRQLSQRCLSPASVHRHHAPVHAALERAVKWGMVPAKVAHRRPAVFH
jgi:integrase